MKKLLIAAILMLTINTASAANLQPASTTQTAGSTVASSVPERIDGLVNVEKRGIFHHTFTYKLLTGKTLVTDNKIPHVKELRTYEVAHPMRKWIQDFCTRWESTAGMITLGATSYAGARGNLFGSKK